MKAVIWKRKSEREHPGRPRTFFETVSWQVYMRPQVWSPPTDLYETETAYIVRVEIAGVQEQDFSVVVENNVLTVHGTRRDTSQRRAFHQMEVHYGEFSAVVSVPGPVDPEKSNAEYEDGFLVITLPKASPNLTGTV